MKKLYVVDVSSMFFRAFYAIPPLTNEEGMPTNALYGFLSMTIKLLRDVKPDYLVFCFDRKEPSFRLELYEDYKANRSEMPEDLVPQVPYVRKLTEALGIKAMDLEKYEADDLIGSLVCFAREHRMEAVIVSGDKDFAQMVGPHVTMYDTMKEIVYDEQGVVEKWGVTPAQMIDYLAIVGDSSDNIPGVKGIGPKGAQKLLAEYKTLDGIYKNIDKISAKAMKEKLITFKDMAYLSQKLVTIVCDLKLAVEPEELTLKPIDKDILQPLLHHLGFKSFEKNLMGGNLLAPQSQFKDKMPKPASKGKKSTDGEAEDVDKAEVPKANVNVDGLEEVEWSLAELKKNVEPYTELWAILYERGLYFYAGDVLFRVSATPQEIGAVLSSKKMLWKGFDLKEIWKFLEIKDAQAAWDQMLAAYVVRAGAIEDFASIYQAYTNTQIPDLASSAQMLKCHLELEGILKKKVKAQNGEKVLNEIELPLVPVLYAMEECGVRIDTKSLAEQSTSLAKDIARLEKDIFKEAGEPFNIASPKQLGQVLFEKLKLPVGKRTKTGYSTDSDVLEGLKSEHKIAEMIIEYRELAKLKSTYVDALPQLINPKTGKLHTNLRQALTTTGRLSSFNPNLQNIPIRTERGRLVRKAFIADPGKVLLSADYSQIELRILAHITEDPGLMKAFQEDLDIHTATAAEIFGVKLQDVDANLRRTAKAVNFGIAYGQGAFGLAETLGIPRGEASDIIAKYFLRFAKVKQFMEDIVEQAKQQGYVETMFGRRRYLDEFKSKNMNVRKFGERAAINAPIQGSASDLVKLAMIKLHGEITIPMLLQVHDELLFECDKEDAEENIEIIKPIMENVIKMKVPLKVNVGAGHSWEDAH